MKKQSILLVLMLTVVSFLNISAQEVYYGPNFITFEAEATTSSLAKWTLRQEGDADYQKYVTSSTGVEPIFDTYLEYTGAWKGGVDTELEYKFTCPKTGDYRLLMRMHQPLLEGEKGDARNDVFVRMAGDFTSATKNKTKADLENDHKFWGRGVNKWGSCHKVEIGSHFELVYGFTAGEEYTFTMSGRSTGTCIDYVLFYEYSSQPEIPQGNDVATFFPDNYRPGLGLVDPVSLSFESDTFALRIGTSMSLPITWEPENSKKDLNWTSSDDGVVSVDDNGKITAEGQVGDTAMITAASTVNTVADSIVITISEWVAIPVEFVVVTPEKSVIAEGETLQLVNLIEPIFADNQELQWTSADTSIATVDSLGLVTAVTEGKVQIRATLLSDTNIYDEAEVTVAELFLASVLYDDDNKYLTTEYTVGQTLPVTIDYHAGTFNTVTDVKVMLRHMQKGWAKVVKDYKPTIPSNVVGSESGQLSVSIDLKDVTPVADLSEGDFYFLFTKFTFSDGNTADKGLTPITIVAPVSGINDNDVTRSLSLYPNPASTFFFVGVTSKAMVTVYDATGSLQFSTPVSGTNNRIQTSSLNAGIYFVKVEGEGISYSEKLVIR